MSIAVLNEKVEDRRVNQVEDANRREFLLDEVAVIAVAALLPQGLLPILVRPLPRRLLLGDRQRNFVQQNAFDVVRLVAANSFGWFAVKAFSIKANSGFVFCKKLRSSSNFHRP